MERIAGHITKQLHNPDAATSLMIELLEKLDRLSENPRMVEEARDSFLKLRGYRRIPFGNYLALYLIDEDRREVTLTNVFYGKQQYIDLI